MVFVVVVIRMSFPAVKADHLRDGGVLIWIINVNTCFYR